MKTPFFSIVLPTYNRAHLITQAIDSVINQSYINWELIIIDDGSSDNTKQVVEDYNHSQITYIYQENQERSAARNNGILQAKGEYICFLDSDDYFLKNHLDNFKNYIDSREIKEALFYTKRCQTYERNFNVFEKILKTIIHSQQTCIHSNILSTHTFNTHINIGEDMELWMRIALEFPIIHIDNETVIIQDHDDRTVNIKKNNSFKYGLEVFESIFEDIRWKNSISTYVKRTIRSDCNFGIAKHYMYNNQNKIAFKYIIRSIINAPSRQLKHKIYCILGFINFLGFQHDYKTITK